MSENKTTNAELFDGVGGQRSLFNEQETQNITDAVTPFHEESNEGTDEGTGVKFTTAELASRSGGLDEIISEERHRKEMLQRRETMKQAFDEIYKVAENERVEMLVNALIGYRNTSKKKLPPRQGLLTTLDGEKRFSLGAVSAVTGRMKQGKTFLLSIITASVLGCDKFNLFAINPERQKVLVIDTEQTEERGVHFCKVVETLTGVEDDNRLFHFSLCELTKKNRYIAIEALVKHYEPTLVILDGIRDLITDINSQDESVAVLDYVMDIALKYNCHIITTLHVAKSSQTESMRGAVGSELDNKAEIVLMSKKENDIFVVSNPYNRFNNIEDIYFALTQEGIPFNANELQAERKQEEKQKSIVVDLENWKRCFIEKKEMQHKELKKIVCEVFNVKEAQSTNKIKNALENHVIAKSQTGLYSFHGLV